MTIADILQQIAVAFPGREASVSVYQSSGGFRTVDVFLKQRDDKTRIDRHICAGNLDEAALLIGQEKWRPWPEPTPPA